VCGVCVLGLFVLGFFKLLVELLDSIHRRWCRALLFL